VQEKKVMGKSEEFSEKELARYQRQIIIPDIGEAGQKKIKAARIFIAGAGGLGSISSYYLAAAGVGKLVIVDRDIVEMTNLNRQIIHNTADIGMPKVLSAKKKLEALNPHCSVRPIQTEMNKENIVDLVGDCSIIVDATDNIETRKVLNYASIQKGVPFIYGGVNKFDGMITTFIPDKTPCFECLFPGIESPKSIIGVIGPLPGVVGSLQAMEAIKIVLGMEGLLTGRLLFISASDMTFREIKVEKNPDCGVCKPWP
jgi:molybdopterin/thiamine biosynthesis adenylyltransferase